MSHRRRHGRATRVLAVQVGFHDGRRLGVRLAAVPMDLEELCEVHAGQHPTSMTAT